MSAFILEPRVFFDAAAAATADATVSTQNTVTNAVATLDPHTTELLQSLASVAPPINDGATPTADTNQISELVFVDSHIADSSQFSSLSSANTEVITLDPNQEGLIQVAAISQNYSGLTNIRIITNSTDSGFEFGSTLLSQNDFSTRTTDIVGISQSLNANGLLSFYSADNSNYLAGHDFVEKLAIFAGGNGQFEAQKLVDSSPILNNGKHEIVFIDSNLTNWQQLIDSVRSGVEVVLINGQNDGLKEIADYVSGQSQIDAIHIVSHASRGELFIGSLDVTAANLGDYKKSLADIGSTLVPGGDILLYGCYLGEGASGQVFLDQIANASGVSVAASNDLTGPDNQGGNWVLEANSGEVLTATAFDTTLVQQYHFDLGGSYTITGGVNVDTSKSTSGLIGAGKQITFDPITITAGSTAQLILNAYDVDYGLKDSSGNQYPIGNANSEWDGVYIARVPDQNMTTATAVIGSTTQPTWTFIGYLTGSNNTWNYTTFDVSSYVTSHGGTGKYVVRVTPDDNGSQTQANNGGRWVVGVASAQIIVDGGAHTATLSNITESSASVSSSVTATAAGTYTVEYNLMDTAGHVVATYSKTMPLAANVATTVGGTLAVNTNFYNSWSALPSGNYTLKVTLLDANGTAQDTGTLTYTIVTAANTPTTGIAALVTSLDAASWTGSSVADIQHIATTDTSPNVLGKLTSVASTTVTSYVDVYVDGLYAGTSSVAANSTAWSIQFGAASSGLNQSTRLLSPGNHTITALYANAAQSAVSVNYTSSTSPVTIAPNITIVDTGTTSIYRVYVRLSSAITGDTLSYNLTGTSITGSYSNGALTLTAGNTSTGDTVANFQQVLRTIGFKSTSTDPTNGGLNTSRTINWQIRYGNSSSSAYSAVKTTTINITPQDSAPTLAIVGTASSTTPAVTQYYAQDANVTINSSITIKDDGNTLASATVSITTGLQTSQDSLAFINNNSSLFGNIVGSYNASTGVLSLSSSGSTATVSQWSAALAAITYSNSATSPSAGSRTISYKVDDGTATTHLSNTVTSTITINATSSPNHAPILSAGGNAVEIKSRNIAYVINSGIQLTDDNSSLSSATISVIGYTSGDTLAFTASSSLYGNISSSYSSGVLTLTSSGNTATVAQWQAALRSVTFSTSTTPSTSAFAYRTIAFKIDDGQTLNHASNLALTKLSLGGIRTTTNSTVATSPPVSLDIGAGTVLQSTSYSSSAPSYALLIDTASTITPAITAIDSTSNLHSTTNRTPTISGTSAAGIQLDVFLDGTKIGTSIADLNGAWTFSLAGVQSLASSSYNFTVEDPLNTKTSSTYSLTVVALTPTITVSNIHISNDTGNSQTDFVTAQASQTITADLSATLSNGETVLGSLDGGKTWTDVTSYVSSTLVTWTGTSLISGYYDSNNYVLNSIQFKVHNISGDGSIASQDYLLIGSLADPVITKTSFLVVSTPTLVGTADPNSVLTITYTENGTLKTGYAQPDINGNWNFTVPNPLIDGFYTFNVTASDPTTGAVAAHSTSTTVAIDTSIPLPTNIRISSDTAGASNSDFITYTTSQTITASLINASNQPTALTSGQTLWGSIDGGTTWTDITSYLTGSNLSWTKTLSEGTSAIDLQVRNLTSGAMSGLAEQAYTIDTVKPTLSSTNAVIDVYTNNIRLTFTETGSGLDANSVPLYSTFTLNKNGTPLTLSANNTTVTILNTNTVNIALTGFLFLSSDTFTLSYSGTSLRDVAGNQVATISNLALTNPIYLHATNDTGTAIEAGTNVTGSDATGNLLTNDQGDNISVINASTGSSLSTTPTEVTGATNIVGTYGTLTIDTDGIYTYVVDNTNSTVNALNTSSTALTDTFTYQLTDSTLNTVTATLTISITGSNDAPTLTAGTATATLVEKGGVANSTAGTASTNITLTKTDVDGSASYDTSYLTSNGWTTANGGTTYSKSGTYGTATFTVSTGVVAYALNDTLTATQSLVAGQSVTETFTVQVKDNSTPSLTTSVDAVFNITGSNDTPTLASITAGSVADSANSSSLGSVSNLFGTLSGSDVDTGTTLSYDITGSSAGSYTSTASGSSVTYNLSLLGNYGTLYLKSTSGQYLYVADASKVDAIPSGTNPNDSFTVSVSDGTASTTQTYTVNLTGANETPTLASVTAGAVADQAYSSSLGTSSNLFGTLSGSDVDTGTTLSYGITGSSVANYISSASGSSVTYNLSNTGTYGTLYLESSTGKYLYVADASKVDAISLTNTTDTFSVFVSDSITTTTTSQTYTINLTGANESPTLASVTDGSVADSANSSNLGNISNLFGTLSGADVDTGTTLSYGITSSSVANYISSASGSSVTYNLSLLGNYGTLYLKSTSGQYLYVADASKVDAIPSGTNPNDSFTVSVSDGTASTTQAYTVNLTGVNEDPIISGDSTGTVIEDTSTPNLTTTGRLIISDIDTNQSSFQTTVSANSSVLGSLSINSIGEWSYTIANADIQYLKAGETKTETFTVTAADGTTHDIVITLNGVNETPVSVGNSYNSGLGALLANQNIITDNNSALTNGSDFDPDGNFLQLATINGLSFSANSTNASHSSAKGWMQVELNNGTLFVKQDGTTDYQHHGRSFDISTLAGALGTLEYQKADGTWVQITQNQTIVMTLDEIQHGHLRYLPGVSEINHATSVSVASVVERDWRSETFTYQVSDGSAVSNSATVTYQIADPNSSYRTPLTPSSSSDSDVDGISSLVESTLASRALGLSTIQSQVYVLNLANLIPDTQGQGEIARVSTVLEGDLNKDGIRDAEQNAVTTFAWINKTNFDLGNSNPETAPSTKAIINLVAEKSGSSFQTANPYAQLNNVRALAFTDEQRTSLKDLLHFAPDWSPLAFDAETLAGANDLATTIDADSNRTGIQWRFTLDISRTGESVNHFMAYYKWIDQTTLNAYAGANLNLTDLDGHAISQAGWYDFTQRRDAQGHAYGDGVSITSGANSVLYLNFTITDNSFGDNNVTLGKIADPGIPIFMGSPLVSVSGLSVNEASPYAVFTVTGIGGQSIKLALGNTSSTADTDATLGTDTHNAGSSVPLQYLDGTTWVDYTPDSYIVMPGANGVSDSQILVRTAITDDRNYEGAETFTLTATSVGGDTVTGTATIHDDGTGDFYPDNTTGATGSGVLDDDRTLSVYAYGPVNESSTYAMFAVNATPGSALNLALDNSANIEDKDSTITGFSFEWSTDGTHWQSSSATPTAPASGVVFVRVNITSEQDSNFEGAETFTLTASPNAGSSRSASGIATIIDNGTGSKYLGTVSSNAPVLDLTALDDDRGELSIPDVTVNEGSPHVVFKVSASSGQVFTLALSDGINGNAITPASVNHDYINNIEIYNGSKWISYTGGQVSVPDGGSLLLVRTPIINDSSYEGTRAFTLTAISGNTTATGRAIIGDFGTGAIFNESANEDRYATKDDDRLLKVDSPIVNEGSDYAVFRVTNLNTVNINITQLALKNLGSGTGFALITPNLQYWTGSSWQNYSGQVINCPSNDQLLVRVDIREEQDNIREGWERFDLVVTSSGGSAIGIASIRDDGTGVIYQFNGSTGSLSGTSITNLDDDFDKDGIAPTTEDALSSLAASQGIGNAKEGDMNGDGVADADQNALATLAWTNVSNFEAGNAGTLTDSKPIISIAITDNNTGTSVSQTAQLEHIQVTAFTDASVFGNNAATDVTYANTANNSGIRTVKLADGSTTTTLWDPIKFDIANQTGIQPTLNDIDPTRAGTQVRLYIDISAAGLKQGDFNSYIKYVSQSALDGANQLNKPLIDLDGKTITQAGWYDFTQRTPGGDGAKFVVANGKIVGIELIITDNAFGDDDMTVNRIFDPGVPVYSEKFIPDTDVGANASQIVDFNGSGSSQNPGYSVQLSNSLQINNETGVYEEHYRWSTGLINWPGISLHGDTDRFNQAWGESRSEFLEISLNATNINGVFKLPPEALIGLDTNDSLKFDASMANGNELPSWIVFNRQNGSISLSEKAPVVQDAIKITIVATDTKSNQIEVKVILKPKEVVTSTKDSHKKLLSQQPTTNQDSKPWAKQALSEQIQQTGSQGLQRDAINLLRNLSEVFG